MTKCFHGSECDGQIIKTGKPDEFGCIPAHCDKCGHPYDLRPQYSRPVFDVHPTREKPDCSAHAKLEEQK